MVFNKTISSNTNCVSAMRHAVLGGTFRVRLNEDRGPGHRWGEVLDDAGNVIGSAQDYTYGGSGFAVHTRPFAGYVPTHQIEFVE